MANYINELFDFINKGSSMFLASKNIQNILDENGFIELTNSVMKHKITEGGRYYKIINDSAVFAFKLGWGPLKYKIIGTHLDTPGFRIKFNPVITSGNYIELNTEVYGGPIISTWFDRPLSISGRVCVKSKDILNPINLLIDPKEPIMVIPSLAIHQNREVNNGNGVKLSPQKHALPIISYTNEKINKDILLEFIAKRLQIEIKDILEVDLFLYPCEEGCVIGLDKKFISSSRLDNLSMTYSALIAFIESDPESGANVLVCYDNEEVGSNSVGGADSPNFIFTLESIAIALKKSRIEFLSALDESFIISADVAHLYHPNYPEKSDPTNKVLPGNGPAIKISANCSYTTKANSAAVFKQICEKAQIPHQTFVNHSDLRGGSTIGPIMSTQLGIRSIDIGTPILSMHSARELMATEDFLNTIKAFNAFYQS